MRDLDARMSGQQTIARDAVDAKASIAGMQIAVRDVRLANNPADLQKANDNLAARLKSTNHFADEMLKLSNSAENRARIEKLKTRAADYVKNTQQIVAVRGEAIAAAGGADAAAQIAKLNEEAIRIAREVTLPIAAELEPLANQIAEFAKHNVEEQAAQAAREMAAAEWESLVIGIGTILLLIGTSIFSFFTDRPSDARAERVDGRTCRRQFRRRAARARPQGRTRRGRRRRREIQGRLGAEGARRGGSQDQAGPDRGPAAQGRDGQARRFLRGRGRRDRRDRVVGLDRTRSLRRHADGDRRARAGS